MSGAKRPGTSVMSFHRAGLLVMAACGTPSGTSEHTDILLLAHEDSDGLGLQDLGI